MPHRRLIAALVLAAIVPLGSHAAAQDLAVPLLSTGVAVVSETLGYPTSGPAHVTAAIMTVAPGSKTIVYRHDVLMFA